MVPYLSLHFLWNDCTISSKKKEQTSDHFSLDLNEDMQPLELLEGVQSKLDSLTPSNAQEEYLIKLVRNFKPGEKLDEQMKELFRWGATEEKLWQVQI